MLWTLRQAVQRHCVHGSLAERGAVGGHLRSPDAGMSVVMGEAEQDNPPRPLPRDGPVNCGSDRARVLRSGMRNHKPQSVGVKGLPDTPLRVAERLRKHTAKLGWISGIPLPREWR